MKHSIAQNDLLYKDQTDTLLYIRQESTRPEAPLLFDVDHLSVYGLKLQEKKEDDNKNKQQLYTYVQ